MSVRRHSRLLVEQRVREFVSERFGDTGDERVRVRSSGEVYGEMEVVRISQTRWRRRRRPLWETGEGARAREGVDLRSARDRGRAACKSRIRDVD